MLEAGKMAILHLMGYSLPGDSVGKEVDLAANGMTGYGVASCLADCEDAENLNTAIQSVLTISGRFSSAITTVTALPATSSPRRTTIQIQGRSYSHLRISSILTARGTGPRCPG